MPSPSVQSIPDKYYAKDTTTKDGKEKDKESVSSTGGGRHAKGKRSIDGGKSGGGGGGGGERLSIFGGTFGGSLGKGRKPPPV